MTFLAFSAQKVLLTLQKNQVQHEQLLLTNQVNWCAKEMRYVERAYSDMYGDSSDAPDYADDPYYRQLEDTEEMLEEQTASLDTQLSLIDAQINSFKQSVNNNIKNSCALNLLGG